MGRFHQPTPHHLFLNLIEAQLERQNLVVTESAFGATPDGNRFFGLLALEHGTDDYGTLLGLRSSHDESMTKGIVLGTHVFVCDNTAMTGGTVFKTKNTKNVMKRLPNLVAKAVSNLPSEIERQDRFFKQLREIDVSGQLAEHMFTEMIRRQIVPPSRIGKVIRTWDAECAGHAEDDDGTVLYEPKYLVEDRPVGWTLFNVTTELWRPRGLDEDGELRPTRIPAMMDQTIELSRLFEEEVVGV
jgi:hypothetical protein